MGKRSVPVMVNDNLLPKNIRQIGDIQSGRKICFEDYVMTYIRKMESREDENFLGVFLGERKKTQNTEYVFIRGIMELPGAARKYSDENAARPAQEYSDESAARPAQKHSDKNAAAPSAGQEAARAKTGFWQAFQKRYGMPDDIRESMSPTSETELSDRCSASENSAGVDSKCSASEWSAELSTEKRNASERTAEPSAMKRSASEKAAESSTVKHSASKNAAKPGVKHNDSEKGTESAALPSDPWERFHREIERSFPGYEIQGCCVIGTYPAGRIDELSAHFPEAGRILYHLQDEEERLYWLDGERYEGISGYFVFYEQNQRMQEVLEETFGEKSVEQEGLPDKAIRSFREKVRSKAEERSQSFLKLASSFFVVGVLIVGVIVVNRVQDLQLSAGMSQTSRKTTADTSQTSQETAAGTSQTKQETAAGISQTNQEAAAGTSQETIAVTSQTDREESGTAEADDEGLTDDTSGAVSEASSGSTLTGDSLQTTSDEILAGSDAFWADEADAANEMSAANTAAAADEASIADTAAAADEASIADTAAVADEASIADTAAATDEMSAADTADAANETSAETSMDTTDAALTTDTSATAASAVSRQLQASYVIREGDTLAGICAKYYGSLERLEELCAANDIEDADLILPGQKIVLP
ncbi:MAG: LysM peptidoglycan-binding domain-containing protein [Lachnospiraceae bacterium]|nr:LysM peptidoglycan-binding domain-containing protein [Lachnospiraceae bacterium]